MADSNGDIELQEEGVAAGEQAGEQAEEKGQDSSTKEPVQEQPKR